MPRARSGAARHRRKVRLFREVSGYRGAGGKRYRLAKEARVRAGVNAYRDRKRLKREFRSLWITRLSAACSSRGLQYSRFMEGCRRTNIVLNRKMLSEIAIHDPAGFDALVEVAKSQAP